MLVDFDVRDKKEFNFFHWKKHYYGLWTDILVRSDLALS